MRRFLKQSDGEMMCCLRIQRKKQRPNEKFVRSSIPLHFSLTPGFSRVAAQPVARSRLNGFHIRDRVITGLKSGANEILIRIGLYGQAERAQSFADAKLTKHRIENLFHIHDADDLANCAQRLIKINRGILAG